MSSSALLFYNCEYYPHYGQPTSQCSQLLQRAKQGGATRVNIVPLQYWVDTRNSALGQSGGCNPAHALVEQKVSYFCAKWEWNSECKPFDAATIVQFTEGMTSCLKEAFSLFDEVVVSPHLDDASGHGTWRNMLQMDPMHKDAHDVSYWDIMLWPITKAAAAALRPGKTLWFGLQGEMGATVFFFPQSYQRAASKIRTALAKAPGRARLGIMLNRVLAPGVANRMPGAADGSDGGRGAIKPLAQWPHAERLKANLPALKALWDVADFFGVSNYPTTPVAVQPSHLDLDTDTLEAELKLMGLSIAEQVAKKGKTFFWSEFGIGGGASFCGGKPATTAHEAAKAPWWGIGVTYMRSADPWQHPAAAAFRKAYMRAALQLLAQGGVKYNVSGAFLWSICSWDVQGIHPAGTSAEGTYADPEIAGWVRAHNQRAAKQQKSDARR